VWQTSPRFQLTYGLRLEGGLFTGAPAFNPAIESAFGGRTDALPSEWHVSPRAGFTWSLGGATGRGRLTSPPALIVRGGAGEFRSPTPTSLVTQAYTGTGLDAAGEEITCIGPGVPAADWSAFAADPGSIPDACLTAGPTLPRTFRTVTLFSPDFGAPRAWRASLGLQRPLSTLFRLTLDGNYTRGASQTGYRDLNLDTVPAFRLAAEGNRPVYVDAGDIAAATGAVRFTGSRIDPAFGQVAEIHSDLASEAWQVTIGVGGLFSRGLQAQLAYTYQSARDQGSTARFGGGGRLGGGGTATTAGNPNTYEWARSSFERRHQFLLTFTYPFGTSLEVTSVARLTSGSPYTPLVGSDLNGDGSRNDRAYLFPAGSGAEGDAIAALLARASGGVRDCLAGRLGTIPEHNACTGPWQGSLDFQINWRPGFWGLDRRLSLSLVTVNFLRGLDELLHGADGAKGWGLNARPDPTLLYVTGFDPVEQRYVYQVNDRFGATGGSATAFRPPFQIGVQARFTLGPDRRRAALDAMRGRGGGMGPGGGRGPGGGPFALGGGAPDALLARLDSVLPNTPGLILAYRDTLRLSAEQVVRLEAARDSFALRQAARADRLQSALQDLGANPDPAQLMPVVRPMLEEARQDVVATHEAARAVLTNVQWAWLPESVRVLPPILRRPGPQNR
jgi:hypothetical protein